MFDTIVNQANGILGITIGGVSLATIIGLVITIIIEIRKAHKEARLTEKSIETAFQNVVLPSKIKIDLSGKIQEPLEQGFLQVKQFLRTSLERVDKGQRLVLSILSQFSHVNKLPQETQDEIAEYLDECKTMEVKIE